MWRVVPDTPILKRDRLSDVQRVVLQVPGLQPLETDPKRAMPGKFASACVNNGAWGREEDWTRRGVVCTRCLVGHVLEEKQQDSEEDREAQE